MTFAGAAAVNGVDGQAQIICRGPVAVLEPIKHLASVGGGFFGASSAHPFENPNGWTNLVECIAILLLPVRQVVMFGRMLRRRRHALVLYGVMLALLVAMIGWAVHWDAGRPNPRPGGAAGGPGAGQPGGQGAAASARRPPPRSSP